LPGDGFSLKPKHVTSNKTDLNSVVAEALYFAFTVCIIPCVCVCVCVRERERERECVCYCWWTPFWSTALLLSTRDFSDTEVFRGPSQSFQDDFKLCTILYSLLSCQSTLC